MAVARKVVDKFSIVLFMGAGTKAECSFWMPCLGRWFFGAMRLVYVFRGLLVVHDSLPFALILVNNRAET